MFISDYQCVRCSASASERRRKGLEKILEKSRKVGLKSTEDRDSWQENLANELVDGLEYEDGIEGTLSPVVSAPRRSLTHWRVLTFECAGKKQYPSSG